MTYHDTNVIDQGKDQVSLMAARDDDAVHVMDETHPVTCRNAGGKSWITSSRGTNNYSHLEPP